MTAFPVVIVLLCFAADDDLRAVSIPEGAKSYRDATRRTGEVNVSRVYSVDGLQVGQRRFYRDGTVAEEILFRTERNPGFVNTTLRHGYWRQFHPNGQLFSERPYRNGAPDGVFRFWDFEGNLLGEFAIPKGTGVLHEFRNRALYVRDTETPIVDGKIHGEQLEWGTFEGGRPGYSVTPYRHGVPDGLRSRSESSFLIDVDLDR
ncbi:MAG: toxin-antitoxin system YwqK family antitoxin [Planctomycetales bacterium]